VELVDAQLGGPVGRHGRGGVAVEEFALVEDVAQRVEVAGGEAVRGDGEVVRHIPSVAVPVMWCATGVALSAEGRVSSGRAHETVRPERTVRAAAAAVSAVIRLRAPSWSSSPQRPQSERVWWKASTSAVAIGVARHGRTPARCPYDRPMTLQGEYQPSPSDWVRDQVAEYETSGGQRANTLMDTGMPIIVLTMRGAKSGKVRKTALMRVEHDGAYALVASKGGAPEHPEWFYNLEAHPDEVLIQDGPEPFAFTVREVSGAEKATWWERSVAAYPPYAEYQQNTDRQIPLFVASPKSA
jgi:F420H(2)-dependent quinone reductase